MTFTDAAYLGAIERYWHEHGYAPTRREIGELVRPDWPLSTSVVAYRMRSLRERGLITYDDEVARSVRVVEVA